MPDLVAGPITAWRCCAGFNHTGELRSMNGWTRWPADKPLKAVCDAGYLGYAIGQRIVLHNSADAPHPDCVCGVYALATPQDVCDRYWCELRSPYWNGLLVRVALSGRIVEHEAGYRAQYAQVTAIVAARQFRYRGRRPQYRTVCDHYGVPLLRWDTARGRDHNGERKEEDARV